MLARSYLFIPGDSEKKLAKSQSTRADALILCLEDSVTEENKPKARSIVTDYLKTHCEASTATLWVRVNALSTEHLVKDLVAVMAGKPYGIFLPKPASPSDFTTVSNYLTALEVQNDIKPGSTRLMSVAESASGTLNQHRFPEASPRLKALTWGAEDMSADLGAITNQDGQGNYFLVHQMNRANCLVVAAAGRMQAVDGICQDFKNPDLLRQQCLHARKEGFSGKIAIHPSQVAIINECFTPTQEEICYARQVVQTFSESGGAGTVSLAGKMLDIPHLRQAQRILNQETLMNHRDVESTGKSLS
ncbi:HpcH/HpaI aldolase/citrate lyase family protein [Endozoicomonas elysicola]|uniref:HpcH/HpaI aldolase/citrate lyase family protein n=1 Tax=Endozoicomonas elysicola TaxID=305900 RepID=UPI0003807AD5|nr:CoA ester lyase [Endozoicomonas elysicola]